MAGESGSTGMTAGSSSGSGVPGFGGGLNNIGNLSTIRQIGILVGIAASVALGIIIALWTREPPMRPLPANDRQTTFEIIQFLDQQKTPYVIDSDGVVNLPVEHYQKVQMQLSAQGLGNETSEVDSMLAKDTGFAVSQRLEQARLMRMQEIKLARTLEKFSGIKAVEVTLAIPKDSVFLRDTDKPRASVLLNLYGPKTLDGEQVRAMVDLVVGSVPDLDEARVTITDQFGRLHHSGSQTRDEVAASKEFTESRKREHELQSKIDRVLSPIIGAGKYTVEVHVDMDFSETEQTQKLFNPELPALRSERTLNEQNSSGSAQGVPGALSNQPPSPAVAPQVAGSTDTAVSAGSSGSTRAEADRQFEHDTTIAHTRNQVGKVRRISVGLGLDFIEANPASTAATTAVPADPAAPVAAAERTARSPEQIASITKLVQSAIGYDQQRGDVVEIQSFSFISVEVPQEQTPTPIYEQPWFQELAKYGVAAIGVILFMLMVIRPLMRWLLEGDKAGGAGGLRAMPGMPDLPGMGNDQLSLSASGATAAMGLPPPVTTEMDTVVRARSVVQSDPALVANVIKNWMDRDG